MQAPGLAVDAFATQLLQSVEFGPSHVYQLAWHVISTQFIALPGSVS